MKNVVLIAIGMALSFTAWGYGTATLKQAEENGVAIAAGGGHTCILTESGKVSCWGDNKRGQTTIPSLSKVLQVSAGVFHTCALTEEGKVTCWGGNHNGQIDVPSLSKVLQISAGFAHTCALTEDSEVTCWGYRNSGQTSVPGLDNVLQVSAGDYHACALRKSGKVTCWRLYGDYPINVPSLSKVIQVAVGSQHTCVLTESGRVTCWESNGSQISVPNLSKVLQVVAGDRHTCAITEEGKVTCWGNNFSGQSTIPSLSKVLQVEAGLHHTCAHTEAGNVTCWGDNSDGQSTLPKQIEVQVGGNTPINFQMQTLEQALKKLSAKLYLYKANYVKGLGELLSQYGVDNSKPFVQGYRVHVARHFVLEMLAPLVETTDTPYLKEKVVGNLRSAIEQSRKDLTLQSMHDVDLYAAIYNVAITSSRLAVQNSTQFLLDENKRKDAEKLIADLGALEVQFKTQGYNIARARELLRLLETNQKLIETMTTEPRTTGFGVTLEKIKQYLKGKV